MKIGDIVRNKETGAYGTVEFSSFGVSIHVWDEDRIALAKTLGASISEVSQYWEVVKLPKGYVKAKYGGIKRSS